MIDIVTKEDRNHIEVQLLIYIYIYIFSPRRGKTLPLAIYFNVNKRIPKEWSGLVILDFSNSSPVQRKWKRTHLALEFALWWQSCVLVFLLPTFFVSRRIRDSFHRRRRLSHPPLRPTYVFLECWRTKANNVPRTKRPVTFFPSDSRLQIEFLPTMRHGKLRVHF